MSLLGGKVTCPFCFEAFDLSAVKYRCANPHCTKRGPDTVYSAARNIPTPIMMGPAFLPNKPSFSQRLFNSHTVRCIHCGKETTKRLCPHCHFEFAADMGQIDDHIIAIIGGRDTGKGHYFATLIQRLENEVGTQFNSSLFYMGDDTIRRFEEDYRAQLFRRKMVLAPTVSAAVQAATKTPMVFRLVIEDKRKLRSVNLSFFDSAGEDMSTQTMLNSEARYICYSSGIIFLLDPLQIDAVRDMVDPAILPIHDPLSEPKMIVDRLAQLFREQNHLSPSEKVDIPVAFVLSKIDALRDHLEPGSALLRNSEHFGALNLDDVQSVHTEVITYLQAWMGTAFINRVSHLFSNYCFFGVSALGQPPKNGKVETISPLRVEDPFLWILNQLNLIKGKKGK